MIVKRSLAAASVAFVLASLFPNRNSLVAADEQLNATQAAADIDHGALDFGDVWLDTSDDSDELDANSTGEEELLNRAYFMHRYPPMKPSHSQQHPYPHQHPVNQERYHQGHHDVSANKYPEEVHSYQQANEDCQCMTPADCKRAKTDGEGVIDPRSYWPHKKKCPAGEICCYLSSGPLHANPIYSCGKSKTKFLKNRVLSTFAQSEADFAEWPWMAIILKQTNNMKTYLCGGVLIDHQHVLTVAHCLQNETAHYPKVRLGEWNTQVSELVLPHQDFAVANVALHPLFRNKTLHNDIAVVRLATPVTFQAHIIPVCLPFGDDNFEDNRLPCVTTGWGKNAFDGGQYSNILKEIRLPVVEHRQCQRALRRTRLGHRFLLDDGFVCAGGEEGRDTCKGDAGSPLVCQSASDSEDEEGGAYMLAGLVSWGVGCGEPGVPGVYADIQHFLPWIVDQTGLPIDNYWPVISHHQR